jgi:hypothetical protein
MRVIWFKLCASFGLGARNEAALKTHAEHEEGKQTRANDKMVEQALPLHLTPPTLKANVGHFVILAGQIGPCETELFLCSRLSCSVYLGDILPGIALCYRTNALQPFRELLRVPLRQI